MKHRYIIPGITFSRNPGSLSKDGKNNNVTILDFIKTFAEYVLSVGGCLAPKTFELIGFLAF
jgi:hypothetical protein